MFVISTIHADRWCPARTSRVDFLLVHPDVGAPSDRPMVRGRVASGWSDRVAVGQYGMRCVVHSTSPIGLIEVQGVLRLDTIPRLRTAAQKVMASAPSAIVLDLAGLGHVEELSVSVFPALGRMAAAAADGELILAAVCPTTLALLRRSAPLYVRVFDTREQAIDAAERAPARRRVARQLPADPHAGRTARRVLDDVCNRWRLDALRDAALMIVTELATNAVEHAGPPIELCVTVRQQVLRIEMSDRNTALPVPSPRCAAGSTMAAHGLRTVEGLASRWGVIPAAWGKTVWADLMLNLPQRTHRRRIRVAVS